MKKKLEKKKHLYTSGYGGRCWAKSLHHVDYIERVTDALPTLVTWTLVLVEDLWPSIVNVHMTLSAVYLLHWSCCLEHGGWQLVKQMCPLLDTHLQGLL